MEVWGEVFQAEKSCAKALIGAITWFKGLVEVQCGWRVVSSWENCLGGGQRGR